ncbi:MAG: hypothetical protein ACE5EQ_10260 [Phycisphaerae bacterium]
MAGKSRKKAQKQHKRKQRRAELTRRQAGSPYQRIGRSGEVVACYINEDWEKSGFASLFVLRRSRDQGLVLAAFLVDLWCIGLKDAWGRLDITMDEFKNGILNSHRRVVDLVRIDLDTVKHLVAGGIRFAHQNGFKLPHRYQRWTAMLGDIGDWKSANLREFGHDGKLCYVGELEDLNNKLIGCSVSEFLGRDDVDYIMGNQQLATKDEDDLAVAELSDELNHRVVNAVRKWCFANGNEPHPRLADAVDIMLESMIQVPDSDEDEVDEYGFPDPDMETIDTNMDRLLDVDDHKELTEALMQLAYYVSQFKNPKKFFSTIGIDQADHDDE